MDTGLLVLRLLVGLLFIGHGTQKLFGWFGGHGLKGTGSFFESIGYRPGPFMALIAGATETFAGLFLAAGFLTPLGAAMVIGVMINAIVSVKWEKGLWSGYELDLLYAGAAAALAFTGAGAYSLDALAGWDFSSPVWGAGAVVLGSVTAMFMLGSRRFAHAPAIPEVPQRRAA